MLTRQKHTLPIKLQKLTIKSKSFAFMKIFMKQSTTSPLRCQKVRHYDLELEGASAISGWLKNKIQQLYLRHFYQIKQWKKTKIPPSSPQLLIPPRPHCLSSLPSQNNSPSKNVPQRTRCQTDRQPIQRSQKSLKLQNSRKPCRSQYGQQSQLSQKSRKSNLQNLLQKVRQFNTQSRLDKQNQQQKSNTYHHLQSYDGSRVLSNGTGFIEGYKKTNGANNLNSKHYQQNDMSFCTYRPSDRPSDRQTYTSGHVGNVNEFRTPKTPADKIRSHMNLQEEGYLDKNNLISLKKWHKNQKRHVILNKIKQLQNSLVESYPQEYYFKEDSYFEPASNENDQGEVSYSQGYQYYRTRHPPRSLINLRNRKG